MSSLQSNGYTLSDSTNTCQVLICGSGFSGSLLAWILASQGIDVILIDRSCHPRFAVGESSTPIADFLLERMAKRYQLAGLLPLARYGSWCKTYPQLRVGKKRGFSYFAHQPNRPFEDNSQHSRSLLVAASSDDASSDTHWMRSDVDSWLCQQSETAGARVVSPVHIQSLRRQQRQWHVLANCLIDGRVQSRQLTASWIIDATGPSGILPNAMGVRRIDESLQTRTGALFGHFIHVGGVPDAPCDGRASNVPKAPFRPDDAAQHHLLADGWIWMLRFDCGITSVGMARPQSAWQVDSLGARPTSDATWDTWRRVIDHYPTIAQMMANAQLVDPISLGTDGRSSQAALGWMPRISRLWERAAGNGWLALPSTVGVVDPLHSTGIAHALSGVERAAEILLASRPQQQHDRLDRYAREVVDEVRWIDALVSTAYAAIPDFELFTAACTLYFIAAIECEREMSLNRDSPYGFLSARHSQLRQALDSFRQRMPRADSANGSDHAPLTRSCVDRLRDEIAPWNTVDLLNPVHCNRYDRTAARKD